MKFINKVILQGTLARDAETRRTTSGYVFVNFTVATEKSWADKSGSEKKKTEFHRCVVSFSTTEMEKFAERLQRGSQVYVEGELTTRKWEKDGKTNYSTEVILGRDAVLRMADGAAAPAADPFGDDPIPF